MMKLVTCISAAVRSAMTFLACAIGSNVSAQITTQPAAPDTLFGIRLGVAIEKQFGECPKDEKGEYGYGYHNGPAPCWKEARHGKEVALSAQVLKDTNANISSWPRVRTRDGVVVEIDAEAHRDTWRQAERYMLRHYGKPAETEIYERDSRVFGTSKHRAHTWRANGVTLHFVERASSDNARIRSFNDAWAKIDAAEQEDLRNRSGGK